jgi:hypothetical protein
MDPHLGRNPRRSPRIVVFRFGERVLAIDFEGAGEFMLQLCQQRVVRAIRVVGEAIEVLNLGVEVSKVDEINILDTRKMAAQVALISDRQYPTGE